MSEEAETAGSFAGGLILLGGSITAMLMLVFAVAFVLAAL